MARLARDRLVAGTGVVLIEAALGLALLLGLSGRLTTRAEQPVTMLDLQPPVLRSTPPVIPLKAKARSGAAAPRNLPASPSDIVAPPPVITLAPPPPILAAPIVGPGVAPIAGASDLPGPGTGAGGAGNGRGGGLGGDGEGGGGGGIPPRRIRGRISDSDFPRAIAEAGEGGTVAVRYRVGTDGRVGECVVTGSSGNGDLDALTCRLIQQRFRFAPSRDAAGRKVPSIIIENHSWVIEQLPPPGSAVPGLPR
ncbi:TonB family protein [Sphingomonas crusticola]|uniref:TonB family protein n=1 Tax=Sphingomonas crusticola TaxID=1697973 RepID=UPI001F081BEC|nr:TonB family protein [Sphingomonas crusticola]